MKNTVKVRALAQFLKNQGYFTSKDDEEDILYTCQKYVDEGDYLVLNDAEANEMIKDCIKQYAWAFTKSFLNFHSKAINEIDYKSFYKLQEGCESVNKAIWAMIDDKKRFIKNAILADARGYFLVSYDSKENEVSIDGELFYIYHIN